MKCSQCSTPVKGSEINEHLGRKLCDECYMDALSPVKTCDPWASFNARQFELNQTAPQPLTPIQDRILEVISSHEAIGPDELMARMEGQLSRTELERQFVTQAYGKGGG